MASPEQLAAVTALANLFSAILTDKAPCGDCGGKKPKAPAPPVPRAKVGDPIVPPPIDPPPPPPPPIPTPCANPCCCADQPGGTLFVCEDGQCLPILLPTYKAYFYYDPSVSPLPFWERIP